MRQYYLEKDFLLLFVANLLVTSVYFLLMTTMARYAVAMFDCSGALAGLAASMFLIGGMFGRVVSGRFANQVGHRRIAVMSAIVMLASCMLYFVSSANLALLLAIRLVHGVAFGVANTVLPAMAVVRFPKQHMGEGTGVFMLSTSLGTGVGPLVGLLVSSGLDYTAMFAAVSAMAAITLACAVFVTTGSVDPQLAAAARAARFSWRSFIDPGTLQVAVFIFIVAFSYTSINSFMGSFAAQIGLEFYVPFMFLVYSVGNLVFRPLCGRLMDRFGENAVLYPSIASMAVGLVLCAFVHTPAEVLLVGVFMATGFGTCMSTGQAVVTKRVDVSKTALAIGTFFIMCDAGSGLGPVCLGALVEPIGYRGMYLAAAAICLLALVYYHFACGRKR